MAGVRQLATAAALGLGLIACDSPVIDIGETEMSFLVDEVGAGPPAQNGDVVTVSYRVSLPDGREVLTDDEYRYILGRGVVIRAFDEIVVGMREGGRRVVDCPPHHHWGRAGYADKIPPRTNLLIHVQLLKIDSAKKRRS